MHDITVIRMVAGFIFLFVLFGYLVGAVFYILTLSRAINKCALESKTIQAGTLWLLLVPLVNLVWHFFVVAGMAQTLGNEFRRRSTPNVEPEPGKSIGIAMCVCEACSVIPFFGLAAGPAGLVLWIIYWVKVAQFSRSLDLPVDGPIPAFARGA